MNGPLSIMSPLKRTWNSTKLMIKFCSWYHYIWYHGNWYPCIWYPGSWYHGSSIYSLDLCYLHSHHCEAVTYMNLWAHRINYADSISENYVKLTIQIPSLPNKKIATNKESFRKYFICSIFSSIQSLESQGTSGNRRENENEPNYRQKHIFPGICVKSTTKEIFILVSMYHWLNT